MIPSIVVDVFVHPRDKTSTSGTMLSVRVVIFYILFFFDVLFTVVPDKVAGVCSYSFPSLSGICFSFRLYVRSCLIY